MSFNHRGSVGARAAAQPPVYSAAFEWFERLRHAWMEVSVRPPAPCPLPRFPSVSAHVAPRPSQISMRVSISPVQKTGVIEITEMETSGHIGVARAAACCPRRRREVGCCTGWPGPPPRHTYTHTHVQFDQTGALQGFGTKPSAYISRPHPETVRGAISFTPGGSPILPLRPVWPACTHTCAR